jgi:hypothetical protein
MFARRQVVLTTFVQENNMDVTKMSAHKLHDLIQLQSRTCLSDDTNKDVIYTVFIFPNATYQEGIAVLSEYRVWPALHLNRPQVVANVNAQGRALVATSALVWAERKTFSLSYCVSDSSGFFQKILSRIYTEVRSSQT